MMRTRIFALLLLLAPVWAGAQQLINCAPATPCLNGAPSATGTGDNLPTSFSKSNANFLGLQLPPGDFLCNVTTSIAYPSYCSLGSNLSFSGNVLNATGGGGGGVSTFDQLGSGTNINAIMQVGSGAQFFATGAGLIIATNLASYSGLPSIPTGNVLGFYGSVGGTPTATPAVLISSVTSGGVLYGASSTSLASSSALEAGAIVTGGGPGVAPSTLGGTGVPVVTTDVLSIQSFLPATLGGCGVSVNPIATTNTVCGTGNGVNLTTGINDTGFGSGNVAHTTTGNSNTGVGSSVLVWNSTGGQNTGVGASALTGTGSAQGTGNNNTGVGAFAATLCQGACGNVTAIGASAASNCTTCQNDLVMGEGIQLSSATATGEVDIGPGLGHIVLTVTGGLTPTTSVADFAGVLGTGSYTISTLPTCNSGLAGEFAYVTNAQTTPAYLGTVSTTGAVTAPVFCNGTAWVYH